jgi:hypothetical protein
MAGTSIPSPDPVSINRIPDDMAKSLRAKKIHKLCTCKIEN